MICWMISSIFIVSLEIKALGVSCGSDLVVALVLCLLESKRLRFRLKAFVLSFLHVCTFFILFVNLCFFMFSHI